MAIVSECLARFILIDQLVMVSLGPHLVFTVCSHMISLKFCVLHKTVLGCLANYHNFETLFRSSMWNVDLQIISRMNEIPDEVTAISRKYASVIWLKYP